MVRLSVAALAALTLTVGPTYGQSSQCQWIGTIWSCNHTAPLPLPQQPAIRWDQLVPPADIGASAMRGFQDGQRMAMERRRAQLEEERIAAQVELYRSQAQAFQSPDQPSSPALVASTPDYPKIWLASARPRMHLFPDFEEKVFSPETAISPDMVMFMANSQYAADLAYHFATHRAEAMAVYKMPPLEAARAIDRIERDIQASAKEPTKP